MIGKHIAMASSVSPGASEGSAKKPVVALVDIDSFECQIYKRLYPEKNFWGEPWIVADQTGRYVLTDIILPPSVIYQV